MKQHTYKTLQVHNIDVDTTASSLVHLFTARSFDVLEARIDVLCAEGLPVVVEGFVTVLSEHAERAARWAHGLSWRGQTLDVELKDSAIPLVVRRRSWAPICLESDYLSVAPIGCRSTSEYHRFDDLPDLVAKYPDYDRILRHRIWFSHARTKGRDRDVDEAFLFFSEEDARWFMDGGYKGVLFKDEERPNSAALWVDSNLREMKWFTDQNW